MVHQNRTTTNLKKKKREDLWLTYKFVLYGPFSWIRLNCFSAIEPLRRDSLLFTKKSPENPGNHLIDFESKKLSQWYIQWYWTQDLLFLSSKRIMETNIAAVEELLICWNVLNLSWTTDCVNNTVVLDMCWFGNKYCIKC